MTAPVSTRTYSQEYPLAVAGFARLGWTTDQWDELYLFLHRSGNAGSDDVADWLTWQPAPGAEITYDQVRDLFARYERRIQTMVIAVAAGVPERFVQVILEQDRNRGVARTTAALVNAWDFVRAIGLTEPQAVGWGATDYLRSAAFVGVADVLVPALSREELTALIGEWTSRFGPNAFLWPLAGYTLDEVIALQEVGALVSDQELRVMVALAGVDLPAGI